jgi:branched-subunit amino acid transport protein
MNTTWMTLFLVGASTFAYRASCIAGGRSFTGKPRAQRVLRFVPPAAFASLVAPAVLVRDGALVSSPFDPRLLAALVALAAALLTRNVLATLVSGMLALAALST